MKKVRVVVLGYGHLGKWHCQKVAAHSEVAEFVAIVEKFPAGQEAARLNHPQVKVVGDVTDILDDFDAAIIVTPTSTHAELAALLLNKGKHIFCEKPLCSNDEEGARLLALARNKDLILQVGHSERFHEAWEILRERFQTLTSPFTVRINRVAAFKGRATDVDVVQDLAIHDLDLVNYLFRQKPLEIKAVGQKIRTTKWDHANLHLKLEEGSEVYLVVGRNHVKEIRELEVISKEGMILVDLFSNKIYEAPSGQFEDGSFVREITYNKRDHLLIEHQSFYQSILQNKSAVVNLKDGLKAVHLVDVSLKALDSGKTEQVNFHA
jgi:predicted dehydrogenase